MRDFREVDAVSDVHGRGVCRAPVVAADGIRGEVPEVGYHGHEPAVFKFSAHSHPASREVGAVEPFVESELPQILVFYDVVVVLRAVAYGHFADAVVFHAYEVFALYTERRRGRHGRRRESQ